MLAYRNASVFGRPSSSSLQGGFFEDGMSVHTGVSIETGFIALTLIELPKKGLLNLSADSCKNRE